jgi:hypothetical protein
LNIWLLLVVHLVGVVGAVEVVLEDLEPELVCPLPLVQITPLLLVLVAHLKLPIKQ